MAKKRYQVIDKENARLEEEQYRFETNRMDYEAFTDAMERKMYVDIFADEAAGNLFEERMDEAEAFVAYEENYSNLYDSIASDFGLMKLYCVNALVLCCVEAMRLGVGSEKAMRIRRLALLKINDAKNMDEIHDATLWYREKLRQEYLQMKRQSYSYGVRRAKDYINVHYTEKITASMVADAIGMGRSYLSRNFSKETGMTLTEYIRKDKMERAAMMIVQNHHSLTEISVFLGYGDYTYFSKLFKKEYGVCPEKYLTSSQLRNQNMHFS